MQPPREVASQRALHHLETVVENVEPEPFVKTEGCEIGDFGVDQCFFRAPFVRPLQCACNEARRDARTPHRGVHGQTLHVTGASGEPGHHEPFEGVVASRHPHTRRTRCRERIGERVGIESPFVPERDVVEVEDVCRMH